MMHVAVAEVPLSDDTLHQQNIYLTDEGSHGESETANLQTLVAGFGGAEGALRSWGMRALRPPPLLAGGTLRARAAARRAALAALLDDEPEPDLDEAAVRAMCTLHDAEYRLSAAIAGLLVQPDGRCVWACLSDVRVVCAALPALSAVRELRAPGDATAGLDLHYVQPAIGDHYFVTPQGGRSGLVRVWARGCGAAGPAPAHPAPALAAALPAPRVLLVLAADMLYVWRSRFTPQSTDAYNNIS